MMNKLIGLLVASVSAAVLAVSVLPAQAAPLPRVAYTPEQIAAATTAVEVALFNAAYLAGPMKAGQSLDTTALAPYFSTAGLASVKRLVVPAAKISTVNGPRALLGTSTCVADWTFRGQKLGTPDRGTLGFCFWKPGGPTYTFKAVSSSVTSKGAVQVRVQTVRPVYWLSGPIISMTSTSTWTVSYDIQRGQWLVDGVSAVTGKAAML